MGNIRPTFIKRSAIELLNRYPEHFTEDFDKNKEALVNLAYFHTPSLRNKVAGYITRYNRALSKRPQ